MVLLLLTALTIITPRTFASRVSGDILGFKVFLQGRPWGFGAQGLELCGLHLGWGGPKRPLGYPAYRFLHELPCWNKACIRATGRRVAGRGVAFCHYVSIPLCQIEKPYRSLMTKLLTLPTYKLASCT